VLRLFELKKAFFQRQ